MDAILSGQVAHKTTSVVLEIQKLLPSPEIAQVLFLDPVVVVVNADSVVVDGKLVTFDFNVLAANIVGTSYVCIATSNGMIALLDRAGNVAVTRLVALPGEWDDSTPLLTSNARGTVLGVGLDGTEMAFYAIRQVVPMQIEERESTDDLPEVAELAFMTRVSQPTTASAHLLTLRSGAGSAFKSTQEVLWSISESYMPRVCVEELTESGCVTVAFITLNFSVQSVLPLEDLDGSLLLLSTNHVYLLKVKDVISGNVDLPRLKFAQPSCFSISRSKRGAVTCYAISKGSLYRLSVVDGYIDLELLVNNSPTIDLGAVTTFTVIPASWPENGLTVVWAARSGTRGRFVLEQHESGFVAKDLAADPRALENYSAKDFVFDSPSHRLLGFGYGESVTLTQKAVGMYSMLPGGMSGLGAVRLIYVSAMRVFFIITPWGTRTFTVETRPQQGATTFHEFDKYEVRTLETLAAGIVDDLFVIVTTKKIIITSNMGLTKPLMEFEAEVVLADVAHGVCVVALTNGVTAVLQPTETENPFRSIAVKGLATFVRVLRGPYVARGTDLPNVALYSPSKGDQGLFWEVNDLDKPPSDAYASDDDVLHIGFFDGRLGSVSQRSPKIQLRRVGNAPVTFVDTGYSNLTAVKSMGLWLLSSNALIPAVTQKGGPHSLSYSAVTCACAFPGPRELELILGFNDRLFIVRPQQTWLSSLPYTVTLKLPELRKAEVIAVTVLPSYRAWALATKTELLFVDMKHRDVLKLESDYEFTESIRALTLWHFKFNENTYHHLVLSCTSKAKRIVRTLSLERRKDVIVLQKRLKWEEAANQLPPITQIWPIRNRLFVSWAGSLRSLELTSLENRVRLELSHFEIQFSGKVQDISSDESILFVSTTAGIHAVDLNGLKLLSSESDVFNMARDCRSHAICRVGGRRLILVAETGTFLSVLAFENNCWTLVKRARRNGQIRRLRTLNKVLNKDTGIAVALLADGSYAQIVVSHNGDADISPYLY